MGSPRCKLAKQDAASHTNPCHEFECRGATCLKTLKEAEERSGSCIQRNAGRRRLSTQCTCDVGQSPGHGISCPVELTWNVQERRFSVDIGIIVINIYYTSLCVVGNVGG